MASLITASLIQTRSGSVDGLKASGGWMGKEKAKVVGVKAATTMGGGGGGRGGAKYKGTQMREKKLTKMIEEKVKEAKQVCEGDERSDECKVAWDEVEEVSQAKAHLRLKLLHKQDPLESFCQDNPDTDECLIYED
ncbi:Calvin cycle protein like [Actinidia chinensis var. chinensis]|uniref:Calvin cycle protein like n=1 Tax=Actinidia chinensis var. chinensis TaxID=1590841 RepID=A0A2R6QXR2_ACTCC|nr:Calvin cycle protein like [Actinidia chinensis var. chinensis]